MKCKINRKGILENKLNKLKILSDKGKEYSSAALEVEQKFQNFLNAAMMSETDFINHCNCKNFELTYEFKNTTAAIIFKDGDEEFALPLIWNSEDGIFLNHFKTDAALLLLYISNKCNNKDSVEKIKSFIRSFLLTSE